MPLEDGHGRATDEFAGDGGTLLRAHSNFDVGTDDALRALRQRETRANSVRFGPWAHVCGLGAAVGPRRNARERTAARCWGRPRAILFDRGSDRSLRTRDASQRFRCGLPCGSGASRNGGRDRGGPRPLARGRRGSGLLAARLGCGARTRRPSVRRRLLHHGVDSLTPGADEDLLRLHADLSGRAVVGGGRRDECGERRLPS